jgi:hypothetical protein
MVLLDANTRTREHANLTKNAKTPRRQDASGSPFVSVSSVVLRVLRVPVGVLA